jgi:diguanylate cyclase (GGDEF)-like protein
LAVAKSARRLRLLRPGWLRSYGLLAAAVLVFTGCLLLSFHKLRQQHETELQDVGMTFWLVSQADYELQRLRHALDAYALGHPDYGHDALMQRFDIFWSRLPLLVEGADSALIRESGAAAVVPRMIAALERMEPDLRTLERGKQGAIYLRLAAELEGLAEPLHRLVVDVETLTGRHSQEQQLHQRRLNLEQAGYLLGILASGGLLIALLLRESRRTRALLAAATAANARIEHLARHDPLTDLPNRLLFSDRLLQALRRADRNGHLVALHCLDLDHFKAINDRYGHVAGDRLLIAVAKRIEGCLRQSDTLARLGGDEFALIQSDLSDASGAIRLAERALAACAAPFPLGDCTVEVSVSIGISLYPATAKSAELLRCAADMALYRAKQEGRSRYRLDTAVAAATPARLAGVRLGS